jgi:hypothetical protein
MHGTFAGLLEVNGILSRGLLGVDPYTGQRNDPARELPPSMFRHLRRFHRAVKDEMELISPEHQAFIKKWIVDGKWPTPDSENFAEFTKAYNEFFGTPDIVVPFSPFKLELLDNLTSPVPVDLMTLMENANEAYESELKETPPATAVSDKGASTPNTDA